MKPRAPWILAACAAAATASPSARAEQGGPTGAPPADAKALVEAPKAPGEAPEFKKKLDGTTVAISAGALFATGNSRMVAATVNGAFDTRFSNNGIGASLLGNYGQSAPPGQEIRATAENIQGRLRYDRFVLDQMSVFLLNTGRHDRFQGLDFRYNLDPGVKYLFLKEPANALWAEAGYDFQYDVRRDAARAVLDANGNPVFLASGQPGLLDKTATDHSSRLFSGFKHGFNKEVTLATGLEYLQSFVDSSRYRINFDAVLAANVGGGLAFGVGLGMRYDHGPLPGKEKLDTTTTLSLVYSYSDVPEPPKPPTCPCPEPGPSSAPPR